MPHRFRDPARSATADNPVSRHVPQTMPAFSLKPSLLPLKWLTRSFLATTVLAASGWTPQVYAQSATSSDAVAPAALRRYDIAAGSLPEVLTSFSAEAGIYLAGSTELAQGKNSPGLHGEFSIAHALATLLEGSGLTAITNTRGQYVLTASRAADAQAPLPVLTVTASAESGTAALQQEGKAADGYRAKTVSSLGGLGSRALLDTPYSVSVISQDLIQNIQAQSSDDIYKLSPSTRSITGQGTGWAPQVSLRGFTTYDSAEDGLRRSYNFAAVLEDKERIEVLNGLAGFMYGAVTPAGMINYVYKRPTPERFNSVTAGNYGGDQHYVHGDFGGSFDEAGRVGYRLNLVKQNGGTAIDGQKINRDLVSAAIDWHLSDKLLLELNAVYNHYQTTSPTAYWFYAIPHGPAPDASKSWSQPWIRDEFENKKLTAKLNYRLDDSITLRAAFTHNIIDRPVQDHVMNSVTTAGSYTQLRQHAGATNSTDDAGQLMADIGFKTGPLAHKLTLGYYMYTTRSWNTSYAPHTGYVGPYPLSSPTYVPPAVFPANTTEPYYEGKTKNENFIIGDEIKFNDQWSLLVGINHSRITTENFDAAGAKASPDYDNSHNSPSVSLLFKPTPAVTLYGTYVEGLEMGGQAPVEAVNHGQMMPPMISKQKELGAKAEVGEVLLTTAIFEIERAYEFLNGDVYTQDGRQRHKGWELTATGKPTRDLTVVGGVTLLDTKIKGGTNDGKAPINVAKVVAKLYTEYALPVPGLSLNSGIYYTGKQWADENNTDALPAYTTIDVGARYVTSAANQPLTLRLNVNNLTNKNYWANSYYTGSPRAVVFSAQLRF